MTPFGVTGGRLSILTTSLYPTSRVVGERNQLEELIDRERGSERDRKQKVPGRVERPVPRSGLDGYRKLCCCCFAGSTAAGLSIWLIQTGDE